MKVYNEVTIDMNTGEILSEDSYEYDGPVSLLQGVDQSVINWRDDFNRRLAEFQDPKNLDITMGEMYPGVPGMTPEIAAMPVWNIGEGDLDASLNVAAMEALDAAAGEAWIFQGGGVGRHTSAETDMMLGGEKPPSDLWSFMLKLAPKFNEIIGKGSLGAQFHPAVRVNEAGDSTMVSVADAAVDLYPEYMKLGMMDQFNFWSEGKDLHDPGSFFYKAPGVGYQYLQELGPRQESTPERNIMEWFREDNINLNEGY
jgi:hypothetical protein